MKLKTRFQDEDFDLGEVVDGVIVECLGKHEEKLRVIATAAKGGQSTFYYSSIKKFMDDWEDAPEEPKGIVKVEKSIIPTCVHIEYATEEEAEKAVKKIEAWKRLKDDGITYSLDEGDGTPYIIIHSKEEKGPVQKVLRVLEDLTLLFGGEE